MEHVLQCLSAIKVLFCSRTISGVVTEAHMTLCKVFEALTSETAEETDVTEQDGGAEKEEEASMKKPFGQYFDERLCRVKASCDEQFPCNL